MRQIPNPADVFADPDGRLYTAVAIDPEAGGGMALVRIDAFHPSQPVMIPIWSWRMDEMTPVTPVTPDASPSRVPGREGSHHRVEPVRPDWTDREEPTELQPAPTFTAAVPMYAGGAGVA